MNQITKTDLDCLVEVASDLHRMSAGGNDEAARIFCRIQQHLCETRGAPLYAIHDLVHEHQKRFEDGRATFLARVAIERAAESSEGRSK